MMKATLMMEQARNKEANKAIKAQKEMKAKVLEAGFDFPKTEEQIIEVAVALDLTAEQVDSLIEEMKYSNIK